MADQSEEILTYTCQENSRGVVTGIATDDWTVAEKTRQKPSPVVSVAARNGALRAIVIIAGLLISAGTANAIKCQSSPLPSNKGQWAWRLIDNKKCWYARAQHGYAIVRIPAHGRNIEGHDVIDHRMRQQQDSRVHQNTATASRRNPAAIKWRPSQFHCCASRPGTPSLRAVCAISRSRERASATAWTVRSSCGR